MTGLSEFAEPERDGRETFIPKRLSPEHADQLKAILRQTAADLGIDLEQEPPS